MGKIKSGLKLVCILLLASSTAFAQTIPEIPGKFFSTLKCLDGELGSSAKAITSYQPKATITSVPKGIPTGLSGYWDFQVNGGAPRYIVTNPANSKRVHVTYLSSSNSSNPVYTRQVGYAYSSKEGYEWKSYNSIGPVLSSSYFGLPSITLLPNQSNVLQAAIGCAFSEYDKTGVTDSTGSVVFIDQYDEGGALFKLESLSSNISFGKFQPVWPALLANKDGSKMWMIATSRDYTSYYTVWDNTSGKFSAYSGALKTTTGNPLKSYGIYQIAISESGNKVAMIYTDVSGTANGLGGYETLNYAESTDGGQTFPYFTTLTPYPTVVNGDTLMVYAGCDAVYVGEDLHIMYSSCKPYPYYQYGRWAPLYTGQGIWHWSQATGFTRAVDTTAIKNLFGSNWTGYRMPSGGRTQANALGIDYPSIGTGPDGSLFCVFQAARPQKSSSAFNYYAVLYTHSVDGGQTWSAPVEIETDIATDFRYPTVSKFNPAGYVNVVYQMDSEPGTFLEGAPVTQASLVFAKLTEDGILSAEQEVNSKANEYRLEQNYPNPFNPSTTIGYSLPKAEKVEIDIYDILGRKIASLLNERQSAGQHQVKFDAKRIASGIYFYRLRVGTFAQTKKMVFVK